MTPRTEEPLLSIAVATHSGRRDSLEQLLRSVGASIAAGPGPEWDAGQIEISISDNASDDGTEEMVAAVRAELPCEVRYSRFETNRGLAANLGAAVSNAGGRFCWTIGSDDLVAPEGVAVVLAALRREPDLTGLVIGSIDVDPDDVSLRTRQPPAAFFPTPSAFTVFTDADEILAQCGNAWGALSWSVLDRELWLASAAKRAELIEAHPVFPQVIVKAGMALDRPRWGWEPAVALHRRGADPFIFESGPVTMARKWSGLLGDCCDAWAGVLGGRNRRWRRQVRLIQEVWGRVEDVRGSKLYEDPPLADQLGLLAAWSRSLWPARAFWRELLPALLSPPALTRRLHDPGATPPAAPELPAGETVELEAVLPPRIAAGGTPHVAVTVRNALRVPLPGTGPDAVGVWQRWRHAGGEPVGWDELGVNALGRQPVDLQRRLWPQRSSRVEVALMAPNEPGRYEVTIAGHRHGIGWLDEGDRGGAVSADVEVGIGIGIG